MPDDTSIPSRIAALCDTVYGQAGLHGSQFMASGKPVKMLTIRIAKQFLLTVSRNKLKNKTCLKSSDADTSQTGTRHLHARSSFLYYVYWTVHHLDSWIKIDQLDVTCFITSLFTAQRVSNVSTSIFRSLRLIVDLFHVLYCSGSPAEPHRNTNTHRTRTIQHMK